MAEVQRVAKTGGVARPKDAGLATAVKIDPRVQSSDDRKLKKDRKNLKKVDGIPPTETGTTRAVIWAALDGSNLTVLEIPAQSVKIMGLHRRAKAMGIAVDRSDVNDFPLDAARMAEAVSEDITALLRAGIALHPTAVLTTGPNSVESVEAMLDNVMDAMEHNPLPDAEWPAVRTVLGDELLSALVGVTAVSIRRYTAGDRATPDAVALRLHFVALVNADLSGSYNDLGIRRWWQRPRTALDGRSPLDALGADWSPDSSPAAVQVRELAAALTGAGGAT